MEGWIMGLIAAGVQTAVTTIVGTIVGLIIKARWTRTKKEQTELAELREEKRKREEDERESKIAEKVQGQLKIFETKVDAEFKDLSNEFNTQLNVVHKDVECLKNAMQKDIRRSLRQDSGLFLSRRYASQEEKTDFDELYVAYHQLGTNGVMDRQHEDVMALPNKKPHTKKNTIKKQVLTENK